MYVMKSSYGIQSNRKSWTSKGDFSCKRVIQENHVGDSKGPNRFIRERERKRV